MMSISTTSGLERLHLLHRFPPIVGFPYHFEAGNALNQSAESRPNQKVVIGKHDADGAHGTVLTRDRERQLRNPKFKSEIRNKF